MVVSLPSQNNQVLIICLPTSARSDIESKYLSALTAPRPSYTKITFSEDFVYAFPRRKGHYVATKERGDSLYALQKEAKLLALSIWEIDPRRYG
jgi:hypothetical protein